MDAGRRDDATQVERSEKAVAELYKLHYEDLVRSVLRLLDTRHLAEEVVQEAFLKYHTLAERPQVGSEFAYLRSMALNNARSSMRRRQCAERWRPEMPRVTPNVEDQYLDWDADERLRAQCATLPARQQEVLKLRYWHGMSVAEVAGHLSITTGSVKTHASRGREALRRQLADSAA